MFRRSLSFPITLAVLMIVLLVGLTVGWIALAVVGMQTNAPRAALYITLLSVGTTCLVLVLVGTVLYLWLSVKAINLNRRQSNFIDSVTHELKSPIASLKLYLQTLTRRPVNEEQREGFYQFMLEDVERLDLLINHILHAAQLERGDTKQEPEPVDLTELVTQAAHAIGLRYRVDPETITLDLEPCWVSARNVDMDLIIRNLIDNAVKYAGDPPQVEVALRCLPSGKARLTISDNGPGIPNKLRGKIFSRFVRLGSELERERPGTGLGLYIVRTLLSRWKGQVRVLESSPETGTVFEVQFAAAQPNRPKPSHPPNLGTDTKRPAIAGTNEPTGNEPQSTASTVTNTESVQ